MNIDKYITTENEDLNMPSTSGMEMNVSIAEPLSDKSYQMIGDCVEEIVDKVSQSCDTITNAAQDDSIGDVQQIQILDDVSTVVPNISDPATWPVTRNSKIIDHIITSGPVQTHIDNYPKNDTGRHFSNSHFTKKLANNETGQRRWLIYSVSEDRVYCFCC
ncbi:hypothetical protein JTB14_019737 [Gonioctena quinquepunctata]|nr:hypothetical protein JTB14_019737 [Gonioctena quinquepunctata]